MKNYLPFFIAIIFMLFVGCFEKNTEKKIPQNDSVEKKSAPTDSSLYSDITCPNCRFTKNEKMPTDVCLLKYSCTKCNFEMLPDEEDCCVFCTHGTHKCPSMQ